MKNFYKNDNEGNFFLKNRFVFLFNNNTRENIKIFTKDSEKNITKNTQENAKQFIEAAKEYKEQ
jgi:hypothetical protein